LIHFNRLDRNYQGDILAMKEKISVSERFPVESEIIYKAWLSSKEHSAFTGGGKAVVSKALNGKFSVWDSYISGKNLILEPYERIVQSWRATDFPEKHPDSNLEIIFKSEKEGTKVTLNHSGIPEGMSKDYKKGWKDFYFEPMKKYFTRSHGKSLPRKTKKRVKTM
jgi:activator of HSP90 ATPase